MMASIELIVHLWHEQVGQGRPLLQQREVWLLYDHADILVLTLLCCDAQYKVLGCDAQLTWVLCWQVVRTRHAPLPSVLYVMCCVGYARLVHALTVNSKPLCVLQVTAGASTSALAAELQEMRSYGK